MDSKTPDGFVLHGQVRKYDSYTNKTTGAISESIMILPDSEENSIKVNINGDIDSPPFDKEKYKLKSFVSLPVKYRSGVSQKGKAYSMFSA